MKGFSTTILLAVSRNITHPSGHAISFTYLSQPPTSLRSPPLPMAFTNGWSIIMVFEHIPHPSWSLDNHMCMDAYHQSLYRCGIGLQALHPLRYHVAPTPNSYSSFNHFFMTQSGHTQSSFIHSSPSFASLGRWRLLEMKVEGILFRFRPVLPRFIRSIPKHSPVDDKVDIL